mgnify:CR=1 FL=1
MTLTEIFQKYVDKAGTEELVMDAKRNSAEVLNYLNANVDSEISSTIYLALIGTFLGSDGSVDKAEYAFSQVVFGFGGTYDEFFEMVNAASTKEMVTTIDNVIDGSPAEVKAAFVALGCAFCASNGTMTPDEQRLLAKYLD